MILFTETMFSDNFSSMIHKEFCSKCRQDVRFSYSVKKLFADEQKESVHKTLRVNNFGECKIANAIGQEVLFQIDEVKEAMKDCPVYNSLISAES